MFNNFLVFLVSKLTEKEVELVNKVINTVLNGAIDTINNLHSKTRRIRWKIQYYLDPHEFLSDVYFTLKIKFAKKQKEITTEYDAQTKSLSIFYTPDVRLRLKSLKINKSQLADLIADKIKSGDKNIIGLIDNRHLDFQTTFKTEIDGKTYWINLISEKQTNDEAINDDLMYKMGHDESEAFLREKNYPTNIYVNWFELYQEIIDTSKISITYKLKCAWTLSVNKIKIEKLEKRIIEDVMESYSSGSIHYRRDLYQAILVDGCYVSFMSRGNKRVSEILVQVGDVCERAIAEQFEIISEEEVRKTCEKNKK